MNKIIYAGKHALTSTVSRHMHSSWELIFCTGGSGELVFDGRTLPYSANDIAVIPPFVPHSNASCDGFTNIHVNLDEATLSFAEPVIIAADPNGFILNAFRAALYYYSSPSGGEMLLPLYGQLLAAFMTAYRPAGRHSQIVHEIRNNILLNYPDCGYDLNAYLHTLPFNAEYLKKLFKEETGLTPLQYLTDRRLESAASMLAMICGKGSISETARLCGFGDPLYFSRLFKKKYHTSPRDYHGEAQSDPVADSDSMKTML